MLLANTGAVAPDVLRGIVCVAARDAWFVARCKWLAAHRLAPLWCGLCAGLVAVGERTVCPRNTIRRATAMYPGAARCVSWHVRAQHVGTMCGFQSVYARTLARLQCGQRACDACTKLVHVRWATAQLVGAVRSRIVHMPMLPIAGALPHQGAFSTDAVCGSACCLSHVEAGMSVVSQLGDIECRHHGLPA